MLRCGGDGRQHKNVSVVARQPSICNHDTSPQSCGLNSAHQLSLYLAFHMWSIFSRTEAIIKDPDVSLKVPLSSLYYTQTQSHPTTSQHYYHFLSEWRKKREAKKRGRTMIFAPHHVIFLTMCLQSRMDLQCLPYLTQVLHPVWVCVHVHMCACLCVCVCVCVLRGLVSVSVRLKLFKYLAWGHHFDVRQIDWSSVCVQCKQL